MLLHDGSHQARYTDAVTAHDQRVLLALLVQERRSHLGAVMGTQDEDVTGLNAAKLSYLTAALGAWVARSHEAQWHYFTLEIATMLDMDQVLIRFVRTCDGVLYQRCVWVDEHLALESNGTS